jgi:uncharacterized DUF497 family protein
MKFGFEWDEKKNVANFEKHGIWFEEAKGFWADARSTEFFDPDHSDESEGRYFRVGCSTNAKILLVVFCDREEGNLIRIISARRATRDERKQYEEGI